MAGCEKPKESAEQEVRGVRNPRVIDLISSLTTAENESGGVCLTMIEERHWGSDPEQLEQLQEKFNNYLDYVLDGYFLAQYPQYQDKAITIALQCVQPPREIEQDLLRAMEQYLKSVRIGFQLTVTE